MLAVGSLAALRLACVRRFRSIAVAANRLSNSYVDIVNHKRRCPFIVMRGGVEKPVLAPTGDCSLKPSSLNHGSSSCCPPR